MNVSRSQQLDKALGWSWTETPLFVGIRAVKQGAILGDHAVEQVKPRHHALQVIEFAPRDQYQLALCGLELLQGRDCLWFNHAIMRDRSIVVRRQGRVVHKTALLPETAGCGSIGSEKLL